MPGDATLDKRTEQKIDDTPFPKGRRETRGVGAPMTGTWRPGDVSYETAPAPGGFVGYVCTVAGTPGEWHPWGAIV